MEFGTIGNKNLYGAYNVTQMVHCNPNGIFSYNYIVLNNIQS
jgi:hypothetical protein